MESWKEIAAYLRRSERTVRRWEEKEGLPVHRLQHDKRGSVYAYARELDRWRDSRRALVDEAAAESDVRPGGRRRAQAWGAAAGLVLAAAAALWSWPGSASPPPSDEVVRLVARANSFSVNTGRVPLQTAIRTYQEAIRLDPGHAPAWGGLAVAHVALMWFGEDQVTGLASQARREAAEALRLDPTLAKPARVLGYISHYVDYDHAAAARFFERAMESDPTDAVAPLWFGDYHVNHGRYDDALALYRRSEDNAPQWLSPMTFGAVVHYLAGRPEQAVAELERVLAIQPGYGFANHFLGRAWLQQGQTAEAVAQLRKSDEILGGVPFSRADLGFALARAGAHAEAEVMLADMLRRREDGYYPAFAIAILHLGLARVDEALDWLDTAVDERHAGFYLPATDPLYEEVRDDPRFAALLARMNLPSPVASR